MLYVTNTIIKHSLKQIALQSFINEELTRKLAKNKADDQNSQVPGITEDRTLQPLVPLGTNSFCVCSCQDLGFIFV